MLQAALARVENVYDPNVLIGYKTADDAGVYQLDKKTALVQTADFFTPIVDDPFVYGQIAAANALSDVYAMGGSPRCALSLVGFPEGDLDSSVLHEILRGGADKMAEARVPIIGGHSVKDPELKFGFAVTGLVDPEAILSNQGAQPGDEVLLTKPLGTGVITTAIKFGKCPRQVEKGAIDWMLKLNRLGQDLAGYEVHAATDVTGYGLLGHGYEMAVASGVCLQLESRLIPWMAGVEELARGRLLPAGIENNRRYVSTAVRWKAQSIPAWQREVLYDPQTSGGLLLSLPPKDAGRLLSSLKSETDSVVRIGQVESRREAYLEVI